MVNKRAVLWDMDGVLIDSGDLHFQTWMQTLEPLGIPFDRQKFDTTFGMNNYGVLTVLLGKPPQPDFLHEVSDRKEGLFRQIMPGKVELLPGAHHWLNRFWEIGVRQAVASSAPYVNIEAIVDELKIRYYFTALVSAFDMPGKPDPAVFLEAAHQLYVEPSECVVVEDSLPGIDAARAAGMRCIAVTTTHTRSSLPAADVIVDSLEELNLADFSLLA